ncbi:MAG: acyl-[acyl-carrier-protein]--UDP-N-acetylglucosamine O-acyltransferase [Burkholderiales bacterium]|jgi:UDP-N-acetylglucosamine acyltransferase|nr:acyl-[acyl-carrier-protein]--UDP-N-acetylglucosamine O-acyltransferase [Burkholderiales bacterium]
MSVKIHPTAIVEKSAILHDNVEIGAYAIIGPNVEIGESTIIAHHASVVGHTRMGKNNHIYSFASIGEAPQDKKYKGQPTTLEIGDNNTIREFCTLNIGTVEGNGVTKVGSHNWIMAYSHIAHDCIVGDNTIFANSVALGGHVIVKDWVILGGHSVVHQFCVVGEHVMVAGTTAVAQDVPPYVMASGYRAEPKGINTEGLKRRGFTIEQIENIRHAYKILYRNGLSYNEARSYIKELAYEQPELKLFVEFFDMSTRGIIRG